MAGNLKGDPIIDLIKSAKHICEAWMECGEEDEGLILCEVLSRFDKKITASKPLTIEGIIAKLEYGLKDHRLFRTDGGGGDDGEVLVESCMADAVEFLKQREQ